MKILDRSAFFFVLLFFVLLMIIGAGCSTKRPSSNTAPTKCSIEPTQRPYEIKGTTYYPIPSAKGYVERGKASWYGKPFHGKKTASGEVYNMHGETAAHKTLPMNTVLLVKNLDNGRSTLVRVNDRGPFSKERIVDLSYAKAKELGIVERGVARVEIVAMEQHAKGKAPPVLATVPPTKQSEGSLENKSALSISALQMSSKMSSKIARIKVQEQKNPEEASAHLDHGKFYVQVGAFDDLHAARSMAEDFAGRGRDVTIQQYPAAGVDFYRVLVFAGNSLVKARTFEQQLKNSGFQYSLLLAR